MTATERSILETLEELRQQNRVILSKFNMMEHPHPEWIGLREAATLKGIPYTTLKNNLNKQPLFGQAEKMDGQRKKWRRQTVQEWIWVIEPAEWDKYQKDHPFEYSMAVKRGA